MCEGFEWYTFQSEVERAKQQKADELKKQGTPAPAKSPTPKKQQEDPVPA